MANDQARSGEGGDALLSRERRPTTWLDVVDDLLDEAVDEEATVEAELEELRVAVPLRYGDGATRAEWRFDGTVRVTVEGLRAPLAGWLAWWYAASETAGDE
jgi:hypothetical protein